MCCFDESILAIATSKSNKNFHLKEEQKLAIKEICDGKDVAILPTRFGKSLIYSLIPICMNHLKRGCPHCFSHISSHCFDGRPSQCPWQLRDIQRFY